ncbi:putative ribonuclease H-like domain-containing protein [Tanacetum coccineum]|uniref:Ribonuclease H-like domain-containing protein n=1 Tax=Tanacetum coccineum TaxID=301880 RepID=A0ABQ5IKQ6_9ASTR
MKYTLLRILLFLCCTLAWILLFLCCTLASPEPLHIIIDSLDMSYDREHDDQDDNDYLAKERDLRSREYYYADHMNAILGVYTTLDEFTDLQCDYVDQVVKCERLEKELSKSKTMSKSTLVKGETKIPMAVPISTREPKRTVNQSIATPLRRTVALESTNQKPRSTIRKLYEHLVEIILFIVDSGCSKHTTGNLKLLSNFVEKFLGTVKFGNDQIAPILDLEVAFWKSTCYIRDLKGNDLLTGSRGAYRTVQTDKGTKFLNKTLHAYFSQEGIEHQTSVARTPEQNSVVERQNRTLVEATRTMLSATKVPLDDENLDKMKEKGDACIFVGYSTQSRAYQVYNKRTKVIVETIHVNFDELPQMVSDHVSSDLVPQCRTTTLEHDSLSPGPRSQC